MPTGPPRAVGREAVSAMRSMERKALHQEAGSVAWPSMQRQQREPQAPAGRLRALDKESLVTVPSQGQATVLVSSRAQGAV